MASEIELESHYTTNHHQPPAQQPSSSSSRHEIGSSLSLSSSSLLSSTTSIPTSPATITINAGHYSMLINNDVEELRAEFSPPTENLSNLVECDTNNTMLHLAASISQLDFINCIIENNPQLVWQKNSMDDLPIHVAAKACQFEAVYRLVYWANDLQESSMLEMVNKEKNTALHIALENQQEGMAKCLFEAYPKAYYFLNQEGISPLYLAIKAEFWELVSEMLSDDFVRGYVEDAQQMLLEERSKSVVHAAIIAQKKDILQKMLTKYPELIYNKTDELGRRPLSYAAYTGFLDGVNCILTTKGFQNQAFKRDDDDEHGSFPIHSACKGGDLNVVNSLFSKLPEKSWLLRNKKGQSILHVAATSGKTKIVKFILRNSKLETMINMKDDDGNTPLHLAALGKHPRVTYVLAWDKRVNLQLQNKNRATALDIVEDHQDQVPSFEERLTWLSLMNAGVPTAPQLHYLNIDIIKSQDITNSIGNSHTNNPTVPPTTIELDQQELVNLTKNHPKKKRKNKYKERINALLVVATLVATVTFSSGFSVPGGYNNNNPHEGLATLAHKVAFQVFVISNSTSMYSAILSVVTLIWAQLDDPRLVLVSLDFALLLLGLALAMMSVAFTAAMYVVLHTIVFWLGVVVLMLGGTFFCAVLVFIIPFYSPTSCVRNKFLCYVSHVSFMLMLLACEKGKRRAHCK